MELIINTSDTITEDMTVGIKNIKTELKHEFPEIKFEVKGKLVKDCYGVNSYTVITIKYNTDLDAYKLVDIKEHLLKYKKSTRKTKVRYGGAQVIDLIKK